MAAWSRRRIGVVATLVILVLLLLLPFVIAWSLGWRWQGIGWRQGLVITGLWQQQGECRPLSLRGLRLSSLRPITVTVDSVSIRQCDSDTATEPLSELPDLPALHVKVWALQWQDYPPLSLELTQENGHWRGRAGFRNGEVLGDYQQDSGAWQVHGQIPVSDLDSRAIGVVELGGSGQWLPDQPVRADLALAGSELGMAGEDYRANLSGTVTVEQPRWQASLTLSDPLALPAGWRLLPGEGLTASGTFDGLIEQAKGRLQARGPQGQALLTLASDDQRLGAGQGRLTLSEGMDGTVAFQWQGVQLLVAPFELTLPEQMRLSLRESVTMPLAADGDVTLPLSAHYQGATVTAENSQLLWSPDGVHWQGALSLSGQWQGYRLSGGWRGRAGADGVSGEPLKVRLENADLSVEATAPVAELKPPHWPVQASLKGHYQRLPFQARMSGRRDDHGGWAGSLDADVDAADYLDQGGTARLDGRWQWREGVFTLASGAAISVAQAVHGKMLLKPLSLTARTPLRYQDGGIHGQLALRGEGLLAERWELPVLTGTVNLNGQRARAELAVKDWEASLAVSARPFGTGYAGDLSLASALRPELSRGLGFTLQSGQLVADGDWLWDEVVSFGVKANVSGADLDWGSVLARGLNARLALDWQDGEADLRTREPISLASVDVGTPITNIRLSGHSDLEVWRFSDIRAEVLGGEVLAPKLQWPSDQWQTVVVTGIDLNQVAALQNEPAVSLSGTVGGYLPLRLSRNSMAVRGGRLSNEGPLSLEVPMTSAVQAMARSNQAVGLALDSLNPLLISRFFAQLDMEDSGWLDAAVTIEGINPQQNRLPVVFNYTHKENVRDLLRSLRIGDQITDEIMNRTPMESTQ
ncbi:MAG: YdbH domain-containing protein [Alcanivorax sp.]|nr:YdbH domain-containing protein [Alcanivorax sp.]